jgi:hypothetical protein
MYLPLSVSGARSDAALLLDPDQAITAETVLALGLFGDLSAVRFLVDRLSHQDFAPAAATALHLITGADLREEAFIPEAVGEDELFADELEIYRATGESPRHPDDRLFGTTVQRASRDSGAWNAWLETHKSLFNPAQRYRLGKPLSLSTLVDTLVSSSFSRQVRSLVGEELLIRYRVDVPFEADMWVCDQKKQINAIARACRASEPSFQAGEWYFAGNRM